MIDKIIQLYTSSTSFYIVKEIDNIVTDVKDNYLFALSKAANADYFVTGDKLLLQVNNYENT